MALKTIEGAAGLVVRLVDRAFGHLPEGALPHIAGPMSQIHDITDPEQYGGAHLVGTSAGVVICHGSSSRLAHLQCHPAGHRGHKGGPGRATRIRAGPFMTDPDDFEPDSFEPVLDYSFTDPEHLHEALRHRSWVAETGQEPSNERLEFLGDTILQLVVTDFIFAHYPDHPEGELAKLRSSAVNKEVLFEVAGDISLGDHLMLGKGEESTGGRGKASILADAMEAVLGAVYLDGGLEPARRLILRLWEERIRSSAESPGWSDYKSRLQEHLAREGRKPGYSISEAGPDHEKLFTAVVSVSRTDWGTGTGRSKREAQQSAAKQALDALEAAPEDRG